MECIVRCYLKGFQIEQGQSMEETQGGFGEADGVFHELCRTAARWNTLMEQQPVERVHRSSQLGHLERLDQLRRIHKLLLGPLFGAGRLAVIAAIATNQSINY